MRFKQPPTGKFILPLTAALFLTLVLCAPTASAQETTAVVDPGTIDAFNETITFAKDGSASITEEIAADFTREAHHGIFTNIPLTYTDQNGKTFNLNLKITGVTNENNTPLKYQETKDADNINLKIGDPVIMIQSKVTYRISYTVANSLIKTDDGAELFWNVTGNNWGMPIKTSTIKINLPETVTADQLLLDCFIGRPGSEAKLCKLRLENDNSIQGQIVKSLAANEGFTINVHFPQDYFNLPAPSAGTQVIAPTNGQSGTVPQTSATVPQTTPQDNSFYFFAFITLFLKLSAKILFKI